MAIGDILKGIGTVAGRAGKVAGTVAADVLPDIGLELTGQAGPLDYEKRQRAQQLQDQRTAVLGQSIEQALQTETDPAKRTALFQQLEKLVTPATTQGPSLVQKLHKIVHPKGSVAGPMQETLGAQGPSQLAQMLGQVPPVQKSQAVKFGSFDIPGEALASAGITHDAMGGQIDPNRTYRERDVQGQTGYVPSTPTPSRNYGLKAMGNQLPEGSVDVNGQPILEAPPDSYWASRDGRTWVLQAPKATSATIGNRRVVYNAETGDVIDEVHTEQGPVGPVSLGSTGSRGYVGVNPVTGAPEVGTLPTSRAPITGPPVGRGNAPPQLTPRGPAAQAAPSADPAQRQSAPPAKRPIVPRVSAPQAAPRAAKAPPMPAGMYNQQLQVARPVRVAANQIFGDPSQPDFKPLSEYGDVMNNPQSVRRIGAAARLMIQDMTDIEHSKSGGLWTLVETYGGLPQALAQAESEQTRQAMATLAPRERELLNAEMDAYGAIIGLRAITKGSAARFSAKSLEREVPIPGISAFDAFSFYDKLSRLGEEVWSGSKGISPGVLPEKDYYHQQFQRLTQLKEQYRPKRKVGDVVTLRGGKQGHITKIYPDGTFDAE